MRKYPPFCIHFYKEHVYDFPVCSPYFDNIGDALRYAAIHYSDYRYVRLGYWTSKNYPKKYFLLEDVDVQRSLF